MKMVTMQDLSCLGKCSLTVIHPVLCAMGVQCAVLPTSVLSTHTAFPHPAVTDLSSGIGAILDHWEAIGAKFDGILTGYLANPIQAAGALELMDRFGQNARIVADPAMGDHGRLYGGIGPEMVEAHRAVCRRADLILPNLTEAALLTGLPYRADADRESCRTLSTALLQMGCKSVLLTGYTEGESVGFYYYNGAEEFVHTAPRLPKTCHGTGDLFAAVTMGGLLRGWDAPKAGALAAEFVRRAISATAGDTRFGVAFEGELGWLTGQLFEQG